MGIPRLSRNNGSMRRDGREVFVRRARSEENISSLVSRNAILCRRKRISCIGDIDRTPEISMKKEKKGGVAIGCQGHLLSTLSEWRIRNYAAPLSDKIYLFYY